LIQFKPNLFTLGVMLGESFSAKAKRWIYGQRKRI
jgi:hypothetical protein